jgi:RimJ/RimL family protein N-acetyltransferase
LEFELTRDAQEFASRVEAFLAARIERNVIATVLINLRGDHPVGGGDPLFAYAVDPQGEVRAAALRAPPWPMLVTELDADAADALLDGWLGEDPAPPGVNGIAASSRTVAARWAERTRGRTRLKMAQAMHALERVTDPPRPAAGKLRSGDPADRVLLSEWMRAFTEEVEIPGADRAAEYVDAQLLRGRLFVWFDGRPVSMVATSPTVAGVTRVGPVYTPPELRARGYASSAVAAVSADALATGATRCALFTDLANPTSNKIYADVGYRRIADWEEHAFEPFSAQP